MPCGANWLGGFGRIDRVIGVGSPRRMQFAPLRLAGSNGVSPRIPAQSAVFPDFPPTGRAVVVDAVEQVVMLGHGDGLRRG